MLSEEVHAGQDMSENLMVGGSGLIEQQPWFSFFFRKHEYSTNACIFCEYLVKETTLLIAWNVLMSKDWVRT